MKIEPSSMDADGLMDLCRRAAQILITHDTKLRYPKGQDVIDADPIKPPLPSTRAEAAPHILLCGPFENDPDRVAVAIYVGIGIITVTDIDGTRHAYSTSAIDGDGQDVRISYLDTALRLYFSDVTFQVSPKA